MPVLKTAAQIVDLALREVGSYAPLDTAADAAHHRIGLEYLDLVIAELAGTEGIWWLRPASQTVPLTELVNSYNLNSLLTTRLQTFERAFLTTTTNPDGSEIRLYTQEEYEALTGKDDEGTVIGVYITVGDNPVMKVYRTPATGTTDQIRLYGQTYSDDLTASGGNVPHKFPAAWQLWQIKKLAHALSGGPVARLSNTDRDVFKKEAQEKLDVLIAMNNRLNLARPLLQEPDSMMSRSSSMWPRSSR